MLSEGTSNSSAAELFPPEISNEQEKEISSEKSLSQFLEMGKYADYSVIDSFGVEHKLHKIVLACHSDYFQTIFDSSFAETHSKKCQLTFPDFKNVLPDIFRYMYTSKIKINPSNAVALLNQCEYYQTTELALKIKKLIETDYLPKHVLTILKDGVTLSMQDIISQASAILAENFDAVEWNHGVDLNFLPVSVLLDILNNRALTLDTEYRVYQIIATYTKAKFPSQISEEECKELYSKIFFENLTVEQLEEVYENDHVPRDLICKSLFISLRMALGKPVNQERLGRKYTKHMDTKRGRDFNWSGEHFDTEGIVYWLGTQLDEKTFQNPHKTGHVKCSASKMQTGEVSNVVSRMDLPTWTASENGAFIQLDLSPSNFVLKPTYYSLKHGYSRDNVNLMYWNFEASVDGDNWEVLRSHQGDTSLGSCYGTNTWSLESQKWYRCFRVITIGKYFVQISGIELYGNLLPRTLEAAFKNKE